jgi:hypothetical protein
MRRRTKGYLVVTVFAGFAPTFYLRSSFTRRVVTQRPRGCEGAAGHDRAIRLLRIARRRCRTGARYID